MKSAQRFEYTRFGEALVERGLVDREVLKHVLQQCNRQHGLLPELLVRENLVSDWEISRVACEIYHLPFLTVEQCGPATNLLEGYDLAYLRHYALVPLDRYGTLVTVIMPGLVPSEALEGLRPGQGGRVQALVGSVVSNRRWLEEHCTAKFGPPPEETRAALPDLAAAGPDEVRVVMNEDWGNIFDAGDEAVQLDLQGKTPRRP